MKAERIKGIREGITAWYVRDPEGVVEEYASEPEAFGAAHALLCHYRGSASSDGWPPDIGCLEWGALLPIESAHIEIEPAPEGHSFDEYWSVHLEPTGMDALLEDNARLRDALAPLLDDVENNVYSVVNVHRARAALEGGG